MGRSGVEGRVGKQVGWSCSKIGWGRTREKKGAEEWDIARRPQHQGKAEGVSSAKAAFSSPHGQPNPTQPKSSCSFVP